MKSSYLSAARYLAGGYGMDTSGLTTVQIAQQLVRATDRVNRYCNVPKLPQPFDFRGGTMTEERHQFRVYDPLAYGPGVKRVFLNASPVQSVSAFRLDMGNTNRIVIDPTTQLYVNPMENYVEIIAINPTVVGWWPPYPLSLYEPVAVVTYDYYRRFTATGDELQAISPTLYMASFGNWLEGGDVTVEIDGVEIDPAAYTVNEFDGTITFTSAAAPTPTTEVTADYTYTLDDSIAQATGIIATDLLAKRQIAERGMIGIQSLRVAEVALTQMLPGQTVTRNGIAIPTEAAHYLDAFVYGSVAA